MKPGTLRDYRERMLRALVFIQRHLDQGPTLDEVASVANFSPFHFHRIFRGMVGETLSAHVRRLRLERAAHHLRFTDRPVTRLAFEAGYESHEAFTRAFRGMTGLSPSAYRNGKRTRRTAVPSGVHYEPDGEPPDFDPVDTGGSSMDASITHLAPLRVAFVRHVGPYDQCGAAWERLTTRLGAQGGSVPARCCWGCVTTIPR